MTSPTLQMLRLNDCGVDPRQLGLGNKAPALVPWERTGRQPVPSNAGDLLANLNSIPSLILSSARKFIGQNLNLFIVSSNSPLSPPNRYEAVRFGPKTAGEIVREAVSGIDLHRS